MEKLLEVAGQSGTGQNVIEQDGIELIVYGSDGEQVYHAEPEEAAFVNGTVEAVVFTSDETTTETIDFADDPDGASVEGFDIEAASRDVVLASMNGVPEFRTSWRKIKVGFATIKVPYVETRRSRFLLVARLSSSALTTNALWNAAIDCAKTAAVSAGIVAAIGAFVSGGASLSGSVAAFKSALVTCLKTKGSKLAAAAAGIKVNLRLDKESGQWTKV